MFVWGGELTPCPPGASSAEDYEERAGSHEARQGWRPGEGSALSQGTGEETEDRGRGGARGGNGGQWGGAGRPELGWDWDRLLPLPLLSPAPGRASLCSELLPGDFIR